MVALTGTETPDVGARTSVVGAGVIVNALADDDDAV
jgi:hypothetical protein